MKTAINLIKEFEGFSSKAYEDPIHGWEVPTIGYGTTVYSSGQKVKKGDIISHEKAISELEHYISTRILPSLTKIPYWNQMSEPMQGALISFAYNVGPSFYGTSGFNTITKVLRDKNWSNMREALLLYVNKNTAATIGLTRRRNAEADAWELGIKSMENKNMNKILYLTNTGERDNYGLYKLKLSIVKDGLEHDSILVCSGSPRKQTFRKALNDNSVSGSLEPIPEGKYNVGNIEWAGTNGDWNASWGAGLGPVWISIIPTVHMNRGDFGFHMDDNILSSPGSAGCVVFRTVAEMKKFLTWFEGTAPSQLIVNWNLGSVVSPVTKKQKHFFELKFNKNKLSITHNGDSVPATSLKIDAHSNKIGVILNGERIDVENLELIIPEFYTK